MLGWSPVTGDMTYRWLVKSLSRWYNEIYLKYYIYLMEIILNIISVFLLN